MKTFTLGLIAIFTALSVAGCKWKPSTKNHNHDDYTGGGPRVLSLTSTFSEHYNLDEDAAYKLAEVYLQVDAGNFSTLNQLGFSKQDLEAMAHGQNPSASALANVAQYLNISLSEAHNLIQKIKTEVK